MYNFLIVLYKLYKVNFFNKHIFFICPIDIFPISNTLVAYWVKKVTSAQHHTLKIYQFKINMYIIYVLNVLLSPRNALRWGYSNAAVVPCVRACVVPSVRG